MYKKSLKRIAIIGCAGSGKSTLALELQPILSLPLYHIDQYYWQPNWGRPNFEEFQMSHDSLCDQEEWIIEGTTLGTAQYRFERADCIIFLDVTRGVCFWRVFKRLIKYFGKVRPSGAPGCKERLDIEFLKWMWNFNKKRRPMILEFLGGYQDKKAVYIIRSDQDKQNLKRSLIERLDG